MILTKKSKRILAATLTGAILLSVIPLHTLGAESGQTEPPSEGQVETASASAKVNYVSFRVGQDQKNTIGRVYKLMDETMTAMSDYDATDGQLYLSQDMTAGYYHSVSNDALKAQNRIYLSDTVGFEKNSLKLNVVLADNERHFYMLNKTNILSVSSAVKAVYELDSKYLTALDQDLEKAESVYLSVDSVKYPLTLPTERDKTSYYNLSVVKTGEGEEAVYSLNQSSGINKLRFPISGTPAEDTSVSYVYRPTDGTWEMETVSGVTLTVSSNYSQFYQNREIHMEVTNTPSGLTDGKTKETVSYLIQPDGQPEIEQSGTSYVVPQGCTSLGVKANVILNNSANQPITFTPALQLDSLLSSNPVVVGCRIAPEGNNLLNLTSYGLFSNDKIRISVDIETPLSDSFDKVKINDNIASLSNVSGTIHTYYMVTKQIPYDKEGIVVRIYKGKQSVLVGEDSITIPKIEAVQGDTTTLKEMDSSYFVIVNNFLPKITVGENDGTDPVEYNPAKDYNLPITVESDTVEGEGYHKSGLQKVNFKVYRDSVQPDHLIADFDSDGEKITGEVSDDLNTQVKVDSETKGAFAEKIVSSQKYYYRLNKISSMTMLDDGEYYLAINVVNNCGNASTRYVHMTIDRNKPEVHYSVQDDGQNSCTVDEIAYYDQNATVLAEIYDSSLKEEILNGEQASEYFAVKVKRYDRKTNRTETIDKTFTNWKKTGKNTLVGTMTLDQAGIYTILTTQLKDAVGNVVKSSDRPSLKMGIDQNDPQIEVTYSGNWKSAYLRPFGVYRQEEIIANFTVSDDYTLVDPESVHLYKSEDGAELPITKSVEEDKTVKFSYTLTNNKSYQFRVSAKDGLHRENPQNTYKINQLSPFGENIEIAQTDHAPDVKLPGNAPELTGQDFKLNFTALSSQTGYGVDAGLHSVEVKVYYSDAATKEAAEPELSDLSKKPVAILRDLGNEIRNNNEKQFALTRTNHTETKFDQEKVTSCSYDLAVNANSGSLKSGYYRVVVKVLNNVYDNASQKLSKTASIDFSVSTEKPRLGYKIEGDYCAAAGKKIYDEKATITATVRSRVLTAKILNTTNVFQYTITNTTTGKKNYTFGEWKAAAEPNTYTAEVVLTEEGEYTLSGLSLTDTNDYAADTPGDRSFAIDCTEPSINIAYQCTALDQYLQAFGIYRSDEIKAVVTVTDTYAGVDPKSVSIVNTAVKDDSDQPTDVTSRFSAEASADGKTIVYTYSLKRNVPFTIAATAKDRLKRTKELPNEISYDLPEPYEREFGLPAQDNQPTAHLISVLPKMAGDDFSAEFRAVALQKSGAVNPGLNQVKVEIFYTDAETRADADSVFAGDPGTAIATLIDDGKTDEITDGHFTLSRISSKGDNFSEVKTTNCQYRLDVKVNDSNPDNKLASGYYQVVITVTNNELNPDNTYTSEVKTGIFGIDSDEPELTYSYDGISLVGDDKSVYDDSVTVTATLTDRSVTLAGLNDGSSFDAVIEGVSASGQTYSYSFGKWKKSTEQKNTYYATVKLAKECDYVLTTNSYTDAFGHNVTDKAPESFAVDRSEPKVTVRYSSNVTNTLLNYLTFGLFRNDDVTVEVTIDDNYAGIDPENPKFYNYKTENIGDLFTLTEENHHDTVVKTGDTETRYTIYHHLVYQATLQREKEYTISVGVNDRFNRTDSQSQPQYLPSDAEQKTIVVTDDKPLVKNLGSSASNLTNQDFYYQFRALSQSEKTGTDPGLYKVNVKVYHSDAETKEAADEAFSRLEMEPVAEIVDNGEKIVTNNSRYFQLTRLNNEGVNFRNEKVSNCQYQLDVKTYGDKPSMKLPSGYYCVVITAYNNVLDEEGRHLSAQNTYQFNVATDKPVLEYQIADASLTADGMPVYDQQVTITAKVYDRTLTEKKLNSKDYFDASILTEDGEATSYRFGKWEKTEEANVYQASVTVDKEGFYRLKTNLLKNANDYTTPHKDIRFGVDREEPIVTVTYSDNVTNDLMEYLTFGFYRSDAVTATVEIRDDVAGIDINQLKIKNGKNDIYSKAIADSESSEKNYQILTDETYKNVIHHHMTIQIPLQAETAYNISVSANDRLRRADSKSQPTFDPSASEEKTMVVTASTPYIKNIAGQVEPLTHNPFAYQFRAVSGSNLKATDPGLNSVNVKIYWSDEQTEEAANAAFAGNHADLVADITDNGEDIKNNNSKYFKLSREEDCQGLVFRKGGENGYGVHSCVYTLDVTPIVTRNQTMLLPSGYYYVVTTVKNNVLDEHNEYLSAQGTYSFSINTTNPSLTYTFGTPSTTVGNADVYDQEVTITATVVSRNVNESMLNKSKYFDYVIQSRDNPEKKYRFGSFTKTGDNTYEASVTISKEGFYLLHTNSLKDKNGLMIEVPQDTEFAVDRQEPSVTVQYTENVTNKLLKALTFGLFRSDEISATIDIDDPVAGIDMDKIQIRNGEEVISKETYGKNFIVKTDEKDQNDKTVHHHLTYEVTLQKEKAYTISVQASDRVGRTDSASDTKYRPSLSEERTIVVTEDEPLAETVTSTEKELTNQDFYYQFRALSQQSDEGTDPGLFSVNVKVYHSKAETQKNADTEFSKISAAETQEDADKEFSQISALETIADITDNGKAIDGNNQYFVLNRVEHTDQVYTQNKVSSCLYQLDVSTLGDNPSKKLGSGYYYVVVTVRNNVLDENGNHKSFELKDYHFSIDTDKPVLTYQMETADATADGKPIYNEETTLTAVIYDRTLDVEKLDKGYEKDGEHKEYFDYVITTGDGTPTEYRFDWEKTADNTYTGKVTITQEKATESFYVLKTNSLQDANGYQATSYTHPDMSEKELENPIPFGVDDKAPTVAMSYENTVVDSCLQFLTFGFYSVSEIKVIVTVEDAVAGIDDAQDRFKIHNQLIQEGSDQINSEFEILASGEPNGENEKTIHQLECTATLKKNMAYAISVDAQDILGHKTTLTSENYPENATTSKDGEEGFNVKELMWSDGSPEITFHDTIKPRCEITEGEGDEAETVFWTKNDVNLKFTVNDCGSDYQGDHPGLHDVTVEVYYSDAANYKTASNKFFNGELESIATLTDNGEKTTNADFMTLTRGNNKNTDFKKVKVTDCQYTLHVSTTEQGKSLGSGYYFVKVTATNNVRENDETFVSRSGFTKFGLDLEAPDVSFVYEAISDEESIGEKVNADGVPVYDKKVQITVTVKDRTMKSLPDSGDQLLLLEQEDFFKCQVNNTNTEENKGNPFTEARWTEIADNIYQSTIIVDQNLFSDRQAEGFYEFAATVNDGVGNSTQSGKEKFGIDCSEPEITITYNGSVIDNLLSIITFGIYRDYKITATVTVSDSIAGIEKMTGDEATDAIMIENLLYAKTNTAQFLNRDFVKNEKILQSKTVAGEKTYHSISYSFDLALDVYYNIQATAHDRLNRGDESYTKVVTFDEKMKATEIAVTREDKNKVGSEGESPYILFANYPDSMVKVGGTQWTNEAFDLSFTVKDDDGKHIHSGLQNVTVEMYYSDSGTIQEANNDFSSLVTLADEGNMNSKSITEGGFTLTRVSAQTEDGTSVGTDSNYKEIKVTSCQYNLHVDPKNIKKDGYFCAKVIVKNNVLDGSNPAEAHSHTATTTFGIDTTKPVVEVTYNKDSQETETWNTVDGLNYYPKSRTITIKVTDRTLTEKALNDDENQDLFKYSITSYIRKEMKEADKIENFKFPKWSKAKDQSGTVIDNTYQATVKLNQDGYYQLLFNYLKDRLGNKLSNEQKYTPFNPSTFAIDTKVPDVKVKYDGFGEMKTKQTTDNPYDYYQTGEVTATITVKDISFDPNAIVKKGDDGSKYNYIAYHSQSKLGAEFVETRYQNDRKDKSNKWVAGNSNVTWEVKDDDTYGKIWTVKVKLSQGRYQDFSVKLADNAKNITDKTKDKTNFVLDNTVPGKPTYEVFENNEKSDGLTATGVTLTNSMRKQSDDNSDDRWTFRIYGQQIQVKVFGEDQIAGIKKIEYSYYDYLSGNTKGGYCNFTKANSTENHLFEAILPQFTGYVTLKVTDFCGNSRTYYAKDDKQGLMIDTTIPDVDKVSPTVEFDSTQDLSKVYNGQVEMKVILKDPATKNGSPVSCSGIKGYKYVLTNPTNGTTPYTSDFIQVDRADVNNGQSHTFTFMVPASYNSNAVQIEVIAFDRVNNQSSASTTVNIDTTAPTISVAYSQSASGVTYKGTEYFPVDKRTATITITERNLDPADVEVKVMKDGSPVSVGTLSWSNMDITQAAARDTDTHVATYDFVGDGDYSLEVNCKDKAGNTAATPYKEEKTFTIDHKAPEITVTGVKSGEYSNGTLTATITVKEHNFFTEKAAFTITATSEDNKTSVTAPTVQWLNTTSSNDTYQATVTFEKSGKYGLALEFTDPAGNKARPANYNNIYVDKIEPEIRMYINDEEMSEDSRKASKDRKIFFKYECMDYNYEDPSLVISVSKWNAETNKAEKENGVLNENDFSEDIGSDGVTHIYSTAKTLPEDGLYTFTVNAKDKAANEKSKTIVFAVNRNGSIYIPDANTDELLEKYVTNEVPDIVVREINVDPITDYDVIVSLGGNKVADLSDSNISAEVIKNDDNGWNEVEYKIKSGVFDLDGIYSIRLISYDKKLPALTASGEAAEAKGYQNDNFSPKSDNEVKLMLEFRKDKSVPEVTIGGLNKDQELYSESNKVISFYCEDDYIAKLAEDVKDAQKSNNEKALKTAFEQLYDHLYIKVNGEKLNYTADQITVSEGSAVTLKIPFDSSQYEGFIDVSVVAIDQAGNEFQDDTIRFKLSATWFEQFYSNKLLFFGVIGGIVLLIAVVIIVIVKKKKKKA